MSDLRRVTFNTLSGDPLDGIASSSTKKSSLSATAAALLQGHNEPFSSSSARPASASSDVVTSQQQQHAKTVRLELGLFEPTSNSFPEFNYSKLIHLEKKKLKKISRLNGSCDPFEENDDDMSKIAKELEKKYGSSYGSARRKSKKDDYFDKGAGYDESDSFIDNTEAYDEIIPEEIETVEGGFYINSGALEFKHLSNYNQAVEAEKQPKPRKRLHSSSSSSGNESVKEEPAEVEAESSTSPKEPDGSEFNIQVKNGQIEKKIKDNISIEKDLGKLKGKEKKTERTKSKDENRFDDTSAELNKEKDKEKSVKTTTVKDMLKAKRDSFRKMQEGDGKMKISNGEGIKGPKSNEPTSDSSTDDSESEDEPTEKRFKKMNEDESDKMRTSDVKLVEDLPEDLVKDINEIKEMAKSISQSGRTFQFDDHIAELFLRIDDSCACLDKAARNLVFAHMEYHMSLPKYFLLRKVKQLKIKQEKTKTKKAYMKLKKAVTEVMPSVSINYETNRRKVEEIRSSIPAETLEKMEHPPKYPKKKFPWTEPLRNLLYDLYQVRWISYTVLRTRKETFEDFVNNYLKDKVVPIWPPGWMKFDDLRKELDKRKMWARKPKENKKPSDAAVTNRNKLNEETSITVFEKAPDVCKSVLSSSNPVSVISTKDLVLTVTTKTSEKSMEASSDSPTNTLSITQVGSDVSSNKERSSAALGKSDSKAVKLCTTSSINFPRANYLPSISEDKSGFSRNMGQHVSISGSNYSKNNSKTSTEKKSSGSSVNNHHKAIVPTGSISSNKGPLDLVSPTKRATDHSINSIMSTSPSSVQHSSNATHGLPASSALTNKATESTTTHVITVDNLKNASEIINTTNQLLSSTNSAGVSSNAVSNNPSKDGGIRVRSVSNLNSNVTEKDVVADFNKRLQEKSDQESSSESDGVEIVGVYPVGSKKALNVPTNKSKYVKSGSSGSRSQSPNSISVQNLNKQVPKIKGDGRRNTEHVIMSGEVKDAELDLNQIMRALKELEEMQQSSIHISGGSPPSSNRSSTNSHTSSIGYGKDIKQ